MSVKEKEITYESLRDIPEGYEVVKGRLREFAPTGGEHGFIEAEVAFKVRENTEGYVLVGEVGLVVSKNPLTVRCADIVFLSRKRFPKLPKGMIESPPDLVVEIVYPSNTFEEVEEKVSDYMAFGVGRIVLIDPGSRKVTVIDEDRKISIRGFDEEVEIYPRVKIKLSEIIGGRK